MGAFLIVCCKSTAEEAWELFRPVHNSLVGFKDAGEEPSDYECSVYDCLKGLERAIGLGWYSFNKFDYKLYEHNHKLENGDMNWIIPNKILAFSSPTEKRSDGLPAQHFIDKFEMMNIKGVIRLNESLYDESVFRKEGINVYNLEF